jgi:hypothetical protein
MGKKNDPAGKPDYQKLARTLVVARARAIADPDRFAASEDEEYVAALPDKLAQEFFDALFGRQMRRPASKVPDERLLELYEKASRELRLGRRPLTQSQRYSRVGRAVGLDPTTVRDRLRRIPEWRERWLKKKL